MAFGLRAELGPAKRPARLHIRVAEKGVGGWLRLDGIRRGQICLADLDPIVGSE